MAVMRLGHLAGLCCALFCATAALAAGRNGSLPTPALLVDLARDHGLNITGQRTPADFKHIRTLLRAAARLDPRLAEAQAYLYELAIVSGDEKEAADALFQLVSLDPGHEGAFARFLIDGLDSMQTIERRTTWLEAMLAAGGRSREQQSMLYTGLAKLNLQSLQRAQARLMLDRATGLDEDNPDAAALRLELLDADTPPLTRLRAGLRALKANPLQADVAWQVGTILDDAGYHDEAGPFFDQALDLYLAGNRGEPPPPTHLLQRAYNFACANRPEAALPFAQQAAAGDPNLIQARLLLYWVLAKLGRTAEADAVKQQLARRFADIREPNDWPVSDVAQAAWFYCTIDPQPQRALSLAEAAARRAVGDPFTTRVLGWAQANNLRPQDAERTLTPIAGRDPFAAYRLAKILKEAGDNEAPQRLVSNLEAIPRGGPAYDLLAELGPLGAATQPALRRLPEINDALAGFDRDVLEYRKNMRRFLEAEVTMEDPSIDVGEPWWAVFTLTNKGRFPISLGSDGMVNPVFLLSFRLEGDRDRDFPNLLTTCVDRVRVLSPGQTVRVRRTVDLGPLRRAARLSPQQLQRVTINAILDPEQDASGLWVAAPTGQRLRPAYFNRLPARTERESLHALFSALGGESSEARFRAIEVMAELLGEKQRADLKQLSYTPTPIPADRIYQALLNGLLAESWELRVRTLDALQVAGLDAALMQAVTDCLDHPNWLVRLMAVRLLARQGKSVAPLFHNLAEKDVDELVRDMASSYLESWNLTPTASRPAVHAEPAPTDEGSD